MAKVDLKDVYKVTAKGRTYYYAWRGKGAPRLYAEPGSPAFIRELQAIHETHRMGDDTKLAWLCKSYKASTSWTGLGAVTRTNWLPWLDRIEEHFGGLSIAQFDRATMRPEIRKWRDRFKAHPRAADVGLQVMSVLLSHGMAEGKLTVNLCFGMPRLYRNNRSERIWEEADLTKLAKVASREVMWAVNLALHTGLRQSDLLKLCWSHVSPLSIQIRTGKSGGQKLAVIPMHQELSDVLAGIEKRGPRILTNTDGIPWKTGFRSSFRKACATAKVTGLHFHDLRGTAATVLFRSDFSIREIAEIMTWEEEGVENLINRYVKGDEILRDKIRRLDEARTARAKPTAKPVQGGGSK